VDFFDACCTGSSPLLEKIFAERERLDRESIYVVAHDCTVNRCWPKSLYRIVGRTARFFSAPLANGLGLRVRQFCHRNQGFRNTLDTGAILGQYGQYEEFQGNISTHSTMDEEDCACVVQAAVYSPDESIFLVSREGTRFAVNEQLARRCSPYFQGLLQNGMREAGKFAICTKQHEIDPIPLVWPDVECLIYICLSLQRYDIWIQPQVIARSFSRIFPPTSFVL
jgi:hypothetical protein